MRSNNLPREIKTAASRFGGAQHSSLTKSKWRSADECSRIVLIASVNCTTGAFGRPGTARLFLIMYHTQFADSVEFWVGRTAKGSVSVPSNREVNDAATLIEISQVKGGVRNSSIRDPVRHCQHLRCDYLTIRVKSVRTAPEVFRARLLVSRG